MNTNEYLEKHKNIIQLSGGYTMRDLAPKVVCADGFSMSVQVGHTHYCLPREDSAPSYSNVEVGYPSAQDDDLMPFCDDDEAPTNTVYGYVPIEVVDKIIEKHGGFKLSEREQVWETYNKMLAGELND